MGGLGRLDDSACLSRREFLELGATATASLALAGCGVSRERFARSVPRLVTTLGDVPLPDAGVILPHEHLFLDSRPPSHPQHGQERVDRVREVMQPELEKAHAAGVVVLVDAAPPGLGRRADILAEVSRAAGLPVVVPTGLYRDAWIPAWARAAHEEELRDWMVGELTGDVDGAGVEAGWIKTAASDGGLTDQEQKGLRAAAGAGAATDAVIGCHAVRGVVAREALTIVERSGYRAERFIWIHADQERDRALHEELARRGAWVEFDSIGHGPGDKEHVEMVQDMLDAGLGDRVLLSMDSGWFDPGLPHCREGCIRGYTYLAEVFLPRAREAGIDEATVGRLTRENPFHAFARPR